MRCILLLFLLLFGSACASAPEHYHEVAPSAGRIAVKGGQIYYEVAGEGPALILVHGGFGDRRMWDHQFQSLADDFRVVRYDHRGFGGSPAPDKAYSPVDDLVRLMDHLQIRRAHLVGNSLGGALVLDFALLHPERVNRAVVVASGANGYPYEDKDVESVAAIFKAAREEGLERAAWLWLQHPMVTVASTDPEVAPKLRAMVEENRAVFLMRHWPTERVEPSTWQRLSRIRPPVLFVVGDRDTPLVRQVVEETRRKVPASELVVLHGTDHLPHMEKPDEFNALVRRFLGAR